MKIKSEVEVKERKTEERSKQNKRMMKERTKEIKEKQ